MAKTATRWKSQDGFTLVEMVIVAALVVVGAAVAIPVSTRLVSNAKGDSSLVMAATFIDAARSRAVSERRNVELTFIPPDRIQAERIEVPDGTRTLVAELVLEGSQEFRREMGMPDTPDGFGAGAAVTFSGPMPVMFTSDGSLIDSAGDVTNGTVFIGRPGFPETARAVTVSGVTGMLRSWKWRGTIWQQ